MAKLFETTTIKTMTLHNRFVRSATWEGTAHEDNTVSSKLIDLLVRLARGGVGLIITGYATVRADGRSVPWQLGNYSDDHLPGLTLMVEAIHKAGGIIVNQARFKGFFKPKLKDASKFGQIVNKT